MVGKGPVQFKMRLLMYIPLGEVSKLVWWTQNQETWLQTGPTNSLFLLSNHCLSLTFWFLVDHLRGLQFLSGCQPWSATWWVKNYLRKFQITDSWAPPLKIQLVWVKTWNLSGVQQSLRISRSLVFADSEIYTVV